MLAQNPQAQRHAQMHLAVALDPDGTIQSRQSEIPPLAKRSIPLTPCVMLLRFRNWPDAT